MRAFVLVGPYLLLSLWLIAPVAAQDAATQIVVTTDPVGANVFVDGRLVGAAPVTVTDLLPGEHLVTARTEDGRHLERRVTLDAGRSSVVELAFDPLPPSPAAAPPPEPQPEAPVLEAPPAPTATETAPATLDPAPATPVAASLGVLPDSVPGWTGGRSDPRVGIWIGCAVATGAGILTMLIAAAIGIDWHPEHSGRGADPAGFAVFMTGLGLTGLAGVVALLAAAMPPWPGPESGVRFGQLQLRPFIALGPSSGNAGVVIRW